MLDYLENVGGYSTSFNIFFPLNNLDNRVRLIFNLFSSVMETEKRKKPLLKKYFEV